MIIEIPTKIVSEANKRDHWAQAHQRHKTQRNKTIWELYAKGVPKKLPVKITLMKVGGRKMDDDNLIGAFKYIRDAAAEYFIPGKLPGRADDSSQISWEYSWVPQGKAKVCISFEWSQDSSEYAPKP